MEGGRAYGPGVADMKAGVVANMFAARALKDLGLIDVPMTLMFSPDEELGAPTATRVYRERISGARAVICAEPGFPDGGVTTERRGSGHFHMRISGISAHAGRCYEDGASAILELAHKIVALDAFVDAQAQTIVNTGLISGGNSANAVAPWADARIHITFNTVDAAERLVENVRAVAARTFVPRTTTRISGGIRLHPLEYTADVETLFGMAERACAAMGGYTIRRNRALGAVNTCFDCTEYSRLHLTAMSVFARVDFTIALAGKSPSIQTVCTPISTGSQDFVRGEFTRTIDISGIQHSNKRATAISNKLNNLRILLCLKIVSISRQSD